MSGSAQPMKRLVDVSSEQRAEPRRGRSAQLMIAPVDVGNEERIEPWCEASDFAAFGVDRAGALPPHPRGISGQWKTGEARI